MFNGDKMKSSVFDTCLNLSSLIRGFGDRLIHLLWMIPFAAIVFKNEKTYSTIIIIK